MHLRTHAAWVVVAMAALTATPSHAGSLGFGQGILAIETTLDRNFPVTGQGSVFGHAAAGSTVGGQPQWGGFLDGLAHGGTAATQQVPSGPLAGTYAGRAILNATKFPNSHSVLGSMLVIEGGTRSLGQARWQSFDRGLGHDVLVHAQAVVNRTDPLAPSGTAVAHALDPWFFYPDQSATLDLVVRIYDIGLTASADPGEFSAAQIQLYGAFGRGSVPGQNVLAQWDFSRAITSNDSFTLAEQTLLDRSLTLSSGETYWLTAGVLTAAAGHPAPEPSALTIAILAAFGLAGYRWRVHHKHGFKEAGKPA